MSENLAPYEAEALAEQTEARRKIDAVRKLRLDGGDQYELEHFSPPGMVRTCEHKFLRKMVLGGKPDYFCDDCEWVMSLPQPFAQPKQHIVAEALMKIGWVMKYDGPAAVAMGLLRPHKRLDKEGSPNLPPIKVIQEQRQEWQRVLEILQEYEQKILEAGDEANGSHVLGDGSQQPPK